MYELSIYEESGTHFLYDPIRKKKVILQPEEYVRQCLIKHLIEFCDFPKGLISVEKGERKGRYDLVVYGTDGNAALLCECKAPDIKLQAETMVQAARYNKKLGGNTILLTNGKTSLLYLKKDGTFRLEHTFKPYQWLKDQCTSLLGRSN